MTVLCKKKSDQSTLNSRMSADAMSRMQQDLAASRHSPNESSMPEPHPDMLRQILPKGRKPHVCIVGAGFAGLRCADVLLQHGIKVTMFEARNRVGGRLAQSKVGGHLVDLGPNWIHGTEDNPILDLVRETGTPVHSWGERQVSIDSNGKVIPEHEAAECSESLWELIGKAFKHSNMNSATISSSESLLDFIKNHSEQRVKEPFLVEFQASKNNHDEEQASCKRDLLLRLADMWGAFIGGTTDRQSLKFLWLEECLDGENLFCAGTYASVLEHVAKPALHGADVRLEHCVTKITSKEEQGAWKTTVETTNGVTETFDEVVVTAPLGWLKRRKYIFQPPLSERIIQAIDSLGYGNLDKVYITFPKAFWDISQPFKEQNGHANTSAQQSVPNTTAKTLPLHQPIKNGTNGNTDLSHCPPIASSQLSTSVKSLLSTPSSHYPGFTNWMTPIYAKDTNPCSWTQEALNLAALPEGVAHPTLLFYTSGPTSTHIASIIRSHPPNSTSLHDALWSFFRPYVSLLPNYDTSKIDCKPEAILATGWENDEFAGWGSYTNFQVGLERGDEDVLAIRDGCVDRGLWFAGEHCAPFVALGTVTGAYWSGEGVAKRIVRAYGLGKEDSEQYI